MLADLVISRINVIYTFFSAYYSQMAPPIELTQQNSLCRFKAICYSCMPSSDNAQGLVAITFNKKEEEIR
jgi:nuclear pore complex protein Nup54